MQLLPDWLYGFVPPEWWPDRPREPMFWGTELLPIDFGESTFLEMIFDKKRDVLVWGGCALVTNTDDVTINAPLTGTFSSILIRLKNPAADIVYSAGNAIGAPALGNSPGFAPLESLFSAWQFMARRPIYWPIPIPVPKGGSLQMDLINMNAGAQKHLRFTFWTSLMYEEREFVA